MAEESKAVVPQNIEAEQALLGACLVSRDALYQAQEFITARDFYSEKHRLIFDTMQKLAAAGEPVDMVTLVDKLNESGQLEQAGGMPYIASLSSAVPSASAAAAYAKIIADKALVRALIAAADRITSEAQSGYAADELMELAERSIFELSSRKSHDGLWAVRDFLSDVFDQMAAIKASDGVTGIPTFRDLDKLLSGLQKGDLVLLAARPACGKTTMALNIAANAALRHGKRVAVFSLEMPKEQLVQRMLCTEARVNQGLVRKGMASRGDFDRLSAALTPFVPAELYIDDTAMLTVSEMRSKCRKLATEKHGLDLIVLDYIQLLSSPGGRRTESRQVEVAEFSRALKSLAKELDVPILALSQLSRLAERSGEEPNLSFLRESGALEQDADVVLFLHRPKNKDGNDEDDTPMKGEGTKVKAIVAKHRNGPIGFAELAFIPDYTMFANLASEWVGEE